MRHVNKQIAPRAATNSYLFILKYVVGLAIFGKCENIIRNVMDFRPFPGVGFAQDHIDHIARTNFWLTLEITKRS